MEDGRDLLYLAVRPKLVRSAGFCEVDSGVINYRNLTVSMLPFVLHEGSDFGLWCVTAGTRVASPTP